MQSIIEIRHERFTVDNELLAQMIAASDEHILRELHIGPVTCEGAKIPQQEHKAGPLNESPAPFPHKPIRLQPVSEDRHGDDEKQVGQLVRNQAFRGGVNLKSPRRSGIYGEKKRGEKEFLIHGKRFSMSLARQSLIFVE